MHNGRMCTYIQNQNGDEQKSKPFFVSIYVRACMRARAASLTCIVEKAEKKHTLHHYP